MAMFNSTFTKPLSQNLSPVGSVNGLSRAFDNTFATANFLGTLKPGILPFRFRARGTLSRNDRVDVFRIDSEPGAYFSHEIDTYRLKGGMVQITGYVGSASRSPVKFHTEVALPGFSQSRDSSPVKNNSNETVTLYLVIRSLEPRKKVTYDAKGLFY